MYSRGSRCFCDGCLQGPNQKVVTLDPNAAATGVFRSQFKRSSEGDERTIVTHQHDDDDDD